MPQYPAFLPARCYRSLWAARAQTTTSSPHRRCGRRGRRDQAWASSPSACASRVTGLEQEGEADRELTLFEPASHRFGPIGRQPPATTRDQAELSSNSTLGVGAGDQTKALNLIGCLDIDGIAKRTGADRLGRLLRAVAAAASSLAIRRTLTSAPSVTSSAKSIRSPSPSLARNSSSAWTGGVSPRSTPGRLQVSVRSSFTSHMSTEARVPGVSDESIALNTLPPASMSAALSKC